MLIKTVAAGVNPIDLDHPQGSGPYAQLADPSRQAVFVPGWDVAGTAVATAGDYAGFKVGDGDLPGVFPASAGACRVCVAPAHRLVKVPADVPCAQLGGAPLAALTAYQALF